MWPWNRRNEQVQSATGTAVMDAPPGPRLAVDASGKARPFREKPLPPPTVDTPSNTTPPPGQEMLYVVLWTMAGHCLQSEVGTMAELGVDEAGLQRWLDQGTVRALEDYEYGRIRDGALAGVAYVGASKPQAGIKEPLKKQLEHLKYIRALAEEALAAKQAEKEDEAMTRRILREFAIKHMAEFRDKENAMMAEALKTDDRN